jgi:methylmalonyl-CoA mutase N-terminal domain/subunit
MLEGVLSGIESGYFQREIHDAAYEYLERVEREEETVVGNTHGINDISEGLCETVLSRKHDYLEAYPSLVEEWADGIGEDVEEVDLDARARNFAEGLAAAVDLP